jgi:hypothetical protein
MRKTLGLLLWGLTLPASAWAQEYRPGAASYGVSPSMSYSVGSAVYLPYGTNGGGFVPYSPGPSGGLGIQPRMMTGTAAGSAGAMTSMPGPGTPSLGRPRGSLAPLEPIARAGLGIGGGMAGGPMIQRAAAARRMGAMARPPVGGYPFRQPPSLVGPASSAPSMSM